MNPITSQQIIILVRIIVAHIISDFVLQPKTWVEERKNKRWSSKHLYIHAIISGILIYLFVGMWSAWWIPLVVILSHSILDGLKSMNSDSRLVFILDQVGHLIILLLIWLKLADLNISIFLILLKSLWSNLHFWILLFFFISILSPAGIVMSKILAPWQEEIKSELRKKTENNSGIPEEEQEDKDVEEKLEGLKKAGFWIGCLERVLILIFICLAKYEAIGFLIAAKSIFRFGEIRTSRHRKEAEYILVGTMLSFAIAIILGLLMNICLSWIKN